MTDTTNKPPTTTIHITPEELYAYRSLLYSFMNIFAEAANGTRPDMKHVAELLLLTHVALRTAEDVHGPLTEPAPPEPPQNVH